MNSHMDHFQQSMEYSNQIYAETLEGILSPLLRFSLCLVLFLCFFY